MTSGTSFFQRNKRLLIICGCILFFFGIGIFLYFQVILPRLQPISSTLPSASSNPEKWSTSDQRAAAKHTLEIFSNFQDSRQMYPATINCTSSNDCQLDSQNHRNGYAQLWALAKLYELSQDPDDLIKLQTQIQAYQDLMDTGEYALQNDYYSCLLEKDISLITVLTPEDQATLQKLCLSSFNEYHLGSDTEPQDLSINQVQINQKIQALLDPTETTFPLSERDLAILSTSDLNSAKDDNLLVTDEIARYFWAKETDNITFSDFYALQAFNDLLTLSYTQPELYSDPLQLAWQSSTLLATERMIKLYQDLNLPADNLNTYSQFLQNQIKNNYSQQLLQFLPLEELATLAINQINLQQKPNIDQKDLLNNLYAYYKAKNTDLVGFSANNDQDPLLNLHTRTNGIISGVILSQ